MPLAIFSLILMLIITLVFMGIIILTLLDRPCYQHPNKQDPDVLNFPCAAELGEQYTDMKGQVWVYKELSYSKCWIVLGDSDRQLDLNLGSAFLELPVSN